MKLKEFLEPSLRIFQIQLSINDHHSCLPLTIKSFIVSQNRLSLIVECHQTFFYDIFSIVQPATCLSAVQKPLFHHFVSHLDVRQKNHIDILTHNLFPHIDVFLVSRKTVNHHFSSLSNLENFLFELLHNDPAWHHLPLLHALAYFLRLL